MMKDVPPEIQRGKLPSCPFSAHYERLLEDLDKKNTSFQDDDLLFADTAQDKQLLLQLQAHLPGCPTCTVILARARAQRFWQRQQLRRLLIVGEQTVPSSTTRILQAIVREKQPLPLSNAHKNSEDISPIALPNVRVERQRLTQSSRKQAQNVLAFVAVLALIVASFNLFSRMLVFHGASTGSAVMGVAQKKPAITPVIHTTTWSSVIIALRNGRQQVITSTNPMTGKSAILAFSDYPDATLFDGVSHDGYQVLYHVFDGSQTRYYLQPSTQNSILYTVKGKGGSAIWSTDDSSVFISTPEGIEQVAVKSQRATLAIASIKAPDLRFYRDGYLYFVANVKADASTGLNRIDMTTGQISSVTGDFCTLSYDFWPSPGGSTVYYRCKDKAALYAITNDGTGARLVRADAGRIIGYTAQGEPLTLSKTNTAFQVVKLGIDAQHDQTVVTDVAPGASTLTADGIAVAPYGFSLVALAHYGSSSEKLWYDDLVHHTQTAISNAPLTSSLQVGGWARLQAPA
jgi:hypothetical protein